MKDIFAILGGGALLFVLSGCSIPLQPSLPPLETLGTNTQTTTTPVNTVQPTEPISPTPGTGTMLYHGSYFDVAYPANFTARPTTPTITIDNFTNINTDEAFFTSPDNTVEFFVYAPQWGGEPEDYLEQKDNESFLSETEEPSAETDTVIFRATLKAYDNSYIRSWESTRTRLDGLDTHKVFGIKYKDDAAYKKYKAEYVAFKKSLEQFAD